MYYKVMRQRAGETQLYTIRYDREEGLAAVRALSASGYRAWLVPSVDAMPAHAAGHITERSIPAMTVPQTRRSPSARPLGDSLGHRDYSAVRRKVAAHG